MFDDQFNSIVQTLIESGYTCNLDETSTIVKIGDYLTIKTYDEKFLITEVQKEIEPVVKSLKMITYLLKLLTIKYNAENSVLN